MECRRIGYIGARPSLGKGAADGEVTGDLRSAVAEGGYIFGGQRTAVGGVRQTVSSRQLPSYR